MVNLEKLIDKDNNHAIIKQGICRCMSASSGGSRIVKRGFHSLDTPTFGKPHPISNKPGSSRTTMLTTSDHSNSIFIIVVKSMT
jgi:hypothetical protein